MCLCLCYASLALCGLPVLPNNVLKPDCLSQIWKVGSLTVWCLFPCNWANVGSDECFPHSVIVTSSIDIFKILSNMLETKCGRGRGVSTKILFVDGRLVGWFSCVMSSFHPSNQEWSLSSIA